MLLRELDRRGRVPGAAVGELDEVPRLRPRPRRRRDMRPAESLFPQGLAMASDHVRDRSADLRLSTAPPAANPRRLAWPTPPNSGYARGSSFPSSVRNGTVASSILWYDTMQSFGDIPGKVTTTIVLAEDDADLRALLAECLRRDGHVVWEASDGGEAVSLVRQHVPGLLLLDIWMPILNGLEVLEHLGRSSTSVGVKVVVLSHLSDADTRLEGFALGVDDYWTKDLSLVELCAGIQRLMGLAPIPPVHLG